VSDSAPQACHCAAEKHLTTDDYRQRCQQQTQPTKERVEGSVRRGQAEIIADAEHHHVHGHGDAHSHAHQQRMRTRPLLFAARPEAVAEFLDRSQIVLQDTSLRIPHQVHLAQRRVDADADPARFAVVQFFK